MRTSRALNGLKYFGTALMAVVGLVVVMAMYVAVVWIVAFMFTVALFSLFRMVMS